MVDTLSIVLAQLNPTVGAIAQNAAKARAIIQQHATRDLIVFPELYIAGYPPEDLVLRQSFVAACKDACEALATEFAKGPAVLMGLPWREGDKLHNAVALLNGGRIEALRFKFDLPNYGVFDEKRVFQPGPAPGPVVVKGVRIGVPICEDIWTEETCETLAETGAEILLSPNGSPFERNKDDVRLNLVVSRVTETGLPLAYLNQVGGQDDLVFDGASFVLNADRSLALQMPMFEEAVAVTQWQRGPKGWFMLKGESAKLPEREEETWKACVLGLRDYVLKNRFPGVVLGLSGGIDSAVVAAMAVDALGADKVHCVMLPYAYTSKDSLVDAEDCARRLGVRYDTVPIKAPVEGIISALQPMFAGRKPDITEENMQSRSRGVILMAISNKMGSMVLTTGNKSEMSVGYATLYGDMNGGFNPIKDVYKTEVYRLAEWRNTVSDIIPDRIITKAPTAELRENQKDQDSLPPYDVLDDILDGLVEREQSIADIAARGHELALVKKIQHMLYIAEYKRRQAAPGVKITRRNFGRDRRYPITNGFRDNVVTLELYLAMALFAVVSTFTPGPNNTMLLASGVNHGFRRTMPLILAVNFGFPLMVAIVGLGLGQVFKTYPAIYTVLKYAGAAYMLWLAWKIATSVPHTDESGAVSKPISFVQGALFQWVNPKAWIMAVTSVSAYTTPHAYLSDLGLIVATFMISGAGSSSTWTLFGVGLSHWLSDPRYFRIINGMLALLLLLSLVQMLMH